MKRIKKLGLVLGLALAAMMPTALAKDVVVQLPLPENAPAVTAQQDFYLHVNADWLKKAKIPADESSVSANSEMNEAVRQQLKDITADAVENRASYADGSDAARIADFYACIVDKAGRNAAGLGLLAKPLQQIEQVGSVQEYAETMADICREYGLGGGMLGGFGNGNDPLKNDRYVAMIAGPAVGLGHELMTQEAGKEMQQVYREYMRDLLVCYGRTPKAAEQAAADIFALEQDIAAHSMAIGALHDPSKSLKRLEAADLKQLYKHVDAAAMLNKAGIGPAQGISFWYTMDIGSIKRLDELCTPERLPVLKEQAICALLMQNAGLLTDEYQQISARAEQNMNGAAAVQSEERRNEELNESLLQDIYGRLYAARYVTAEHKAAIRSYVDRIMAEYRKRLLKLDWMSESTKQAAVKKLDCMRINIDAPEVWPEYLDKITAVRPENGGCLINNVLSVSKELAAYERQQIGKPIRKDLWMGVTPQTVNAFYVPFNNSINLPIAYMQPPNFDPNADDGTNMGGVGNTIAHEITHSFDNTGAQFDENGCLRNWWTPKDYEAFKKRQARVIAYYNRYVLLDGSRTNGEQTLVENIADLGAMSCTTALLRHDQEQLRHMYENYAVSWRIKTSDAVLRQMLTDIHALPYVRTNAVLSADPDFYTVYNVKPGDGMYVPPEERVSIW